MNSLDHGTLGQWPSTYPPLDEGVAAGATPTADGAIQGGPPIALLRQWATDLLSFNKKKNGDGVHDDNGAPVLDSSLTDFSGDEMGLMLARMDIKVKDAQAKTAKEGIETARQQKETANTEMIKKLKEALEKQAAAEAKAKHNKVFGWLGKIAAFVGAIAAVVAAAAATVATGGAAVPLLAIAILGAVSATVDLANQINQEIHPGAKPFTLGSLIGDAIIESMNADGIGGKGRSALSGLAAGLGFALMQPDLAGQMAQDSAIADGKSADEAAKICMGVSIAAVVFTIVAMVAVTVASGGAGGGRLAGSATKAVNVGEASAEAATTATKAADTAKAAADKLAKLKDAVYRITKASKYAEGGAGLVQGGAAIGSGAIAIDVAQDQKSADAARAQAKEIEAEILKLQLMAEEQTDRLKEVIAALDEGMQMFSNMVATASDQRVSTIRNMVRG